MPNEKRRNPIVIWFKKRFFQIIRRNKGDKKCEKSVWSFAFRVIFAPGLRRIDSRRKVPLACA